MEYALKSHFNRTSCLVDIRVVNRLAIKIALANQFEINIGIFVLYYFLLFILIYRWFKRSQTE